MAAAQAPCRKDRRDVGTLAGIFALLTEPELDARYSRLEKKINPSKAAAIESILTLAEAPRRFDPLSEWVAVPRPLVTTKPGLA